MPVKVKPFDVLDLIKAHQRGESLLQASKRLGVSRPVLKREMIKAGHAPRSQSTAGIFRAAFMTPEQRLKQATAAHIAVRGKRQSRQHLIKRALFAEETVTPTGAERELMAMLQRRRQWGVSQKAVGIYNIDIALEESRIAVEVFGGNWHATGTHAARFRERTDYILNLGWAVVIVWVEKRRYPLTEAAADQIVAFIERSSRDKSLRTKEFVLLGNGKIPASHRESDGWPII